jgi:hypothetical protein
MSEPEVFTCEQCYFWKKIPTGAQGVALLGEIPRGTCYGCPPTPAIAQQGKMVGQVNLRAQTICSEPACGLFVPSSSTQAFLDAKG